MARVITFSRYFPFYHPKAGEPTYFVEKIWNGLPIQVSYKMICDLNPDKPIDLLWSFWRSIDYSYENDSMTHKHHTIRAGHRWKAGDWFSPRVWSGKPYNSKMITIAPDIQIKKVWPLEINYPEPGFVMFSINGMCMPIVEIAKNDGLTDDDLINWFMNAKEGEPYQIICWNESINY
jgi:hypothetical protein